jgi:hypothetical protein
MLSLHSVERIRARADAVNNPKSNWVELHIEGGYAKDEYLVVNLYFNSPELARAFYEAYPDKISRAELEARRTTVWRDEEEFLTGKSL